MMLARCALKPCLFDSTCPVITQSLDGVREPTAMLPPSAFSANGNGMNAAVIAMPVNGHRPPLSMQEMDRLMFEPTSLKGEFLGKCACGVDVFCLAAKGSQNIELERKLLHQSRTVFLSALKDRLNGLSSDIVGVIFASSCILPSPDELLGNYRAVLGSAISVMPAKNAHREIRPAEPQITVSVIPHYEPCAPWLDDDDDSFGEIVLALDEEDFEPLDTKDIGKVQRVEAESDTIYLVDEVTTEEAQDLLSQLRAKDELISDVLPWLDQNAWGENEDDILVVIQLNSLEQTITISITLHDGLGCRDIDDLEAGEFSSFQDIIEGWGRNSSAE